MSGIYIPWMSMPETCDDCQVSADCPNDEHIDGYKMQERPRFCQLYPVPPHGRLIDADALRQTMYHEAFETDSPMQKWDSGCWIRYKMFERMEENAPTIIPADKEKE